LVGLISRGDVLRWMRDGATGEELLRDVALEVAIAYPDETAGQVADRMAQGRFSRVPVIGREDRKLIGIVTRHELLRVRTLALHAEQERQGAVRLPG
jgi:CIC family chloride channel protein